MRDRVVGQVTAQQLPALRIINGAFEHRLADALGDAAMNLPGQQQRVDDDAEIVDDDITLDDDLPGVRVDFDFADMAAIGEGRRRRDEMPGLGKAGVDPWRQLRRVKSGARHLLDRDPAVGAAYRETAVIKGDIGFRRFKQMRRDLAALGDQFVGRFHRRGTADRQ